MVVQKITNSQSFQGYKFNKASLKRAGFTKGDIKNMVSVAKENKEMLNKYSGDKVFVIRSFNNKKGEVYVLPEPKKIFGFINSKFSYNIKPVNDETPNKFVYNKDNFGANTLNAFKGFAQPGVLIKIISSLF